MIKMIDSDHLFDSTWNIAETHNLLTILYSFCIIFKISIGRSSLLSTSQKSVFYQFSSVTVAKCSFEN